MYRLDGMNEEKLFFFSRLSGHPSLITPTAWLNNIVCLKLIRCQLKQPTGHAWKVNEFLYSMWLIRYSVYLVPPLSQYRHRRLPHDHRRCQCRCPRRCSCPWHLRCPAKDKTNRNQRAANQLHDIYIYIYMYVQRWISKRWSNTCTYLLFLVGTCVIM
jgi:hypothetical protein